MAFEFRLPDIGEGVVEGEVVRWLIQEGETVAADQPMVEVMTDKATVEIPSPRAGKVAKISAPAGQICKVGAVMVTIEEAGGARSQTILVCSAKPGEGKTFCSINLALSLAAERDVEVLLVDADFAKPDVMARLGLDEGPGLLDALADPTIDAERCIVRTDIPTLSLLPAGTHTHNDTELLTSKRTDQVLDALVAADPRRIVIFDSPPALAASPASVLAAAVGQVMMVVRADRTSDGDLREAVQLLDGCAHIQLVLNSVTFTPGGARFGSYYGYKPQESVR